MAKPPSDATTIRTLKARLASETKYSDSLSRERDALRVRAAKAEQELAEWKARFDALLRIVPGADAGGKEQDHG